MSLARGTRVGSYELLDLVGAGGMGEVYRAHDPRLGRDVAIKVIPASFASDPDRVRRFEQEARAAAALSHPNILAVHDVGRLRVSDATASQGQETSFIVMELLSGVTLRERMGGGALPVRKATDIAVQIAHGLAAAHAKSIVHRDLKPENIFITDDGRVKILDFGLAKLTEVAPPSSASAPTKQADTQPGAVMGTAGYMSPEQLRGQTVDHRSDIFAFGAVLYELLAGARAFRGETSMDVATAILKEDPPDLPAAERHIPPALTRIVDRCLEKNPASRFQSAGDLAFALDALSGSQTNMTEAVPVVTDAPSRRRSWPIVAAVAVVAGAVVMYGITQLTQRAPDQLEPTSFPLTLPAGISLVAQSVGGASPGPLAISPDGRTIAMLARGSEGVQTIWVRGLNAITPRQLAGTEGAMSPFWSPDGRHIAFFANRKLKRIAIAGGAPQDLCDAGNAVGGSWGREGTIVFALNAPGTGIQRIPEAGGTPTAATAVGEGETIHTRPFFLPDGRRFLYRAINLGVPARGWIFVGSIDGTPAVRLQETESSNNLFSAGHLLFLQGTTLMARPLDPARLSFTGEAFPVTEAVQTLGNVPVGMFSASDNGVLVYQTGPAGQGSELAWFDRKGTRLSTLGEKGLIADVRLSPDGTRALYSRRQERSVTGAGDVWIMDTASGQSTRFTFDAGSEFAAVWSPDSKQVIFNSNRLGPYDLFMKPADGAGTETEVLRSEASKYPVDWTGDGRHILYWVPIGGGRATRGLAQSPGASARLWVLPLTGDRTPIPVGDGKSAETPGSFSRDPAGRWLTFAGGEPGQAEVHVVPFPPTGARWQITTSGGNAPQWSYDGKEIFFLRMIPPTMMAARVDATGSAVKVLEVKALFSVNLQGPRSMFAASRDGQRFLINTQLAPDPSAAPPPPTVVINWPSWRGK